MPCIFGKEICVRSQACRRNGEPGSPLAPYVKLFVKVAGGCNAACPFCSNAGQGEPSGGFDTAKLAGILDELLAAGVDIKRICLTGGEPATVPQRLTEVLGMLQQPAYGLIPVHLNTNGLLPAAQEFMQHPRVDTVSLSLHHYDAAALGSLYGLPHPVWPLMPEQSSMHKLNWSCNLVRGYIDSPAEAAKMMQVALDAGVERLGFVALMKVNSFCRSHYVDIAELGLDTFPHVYLTCMRDRGADCKCTNYAYSSGGRVLSVYARNYMNPGLVDSSLVYDGCTLRQGFGPGAVIC